MNKECGLLPWILGGLATVAVALALAAISSQRAAAPAVQPSALVAAATSPPPAPVSAVASRAAAAPAVEAAPIAPPVVASEIPQQPELQAGQIWVCTTQGVKTFSNNPCGDKSTLLEVGPINTMNPTTPVRYARAYPPQPPYSAPYRDSAPPSYAGEDEEQDGYDNGANSYTIVQGVAVLPRRRPEHRPHRPPYHHSPAPAPRKF